MMQTIVDTFRASIAFQRRNKMIALLDRRLNLKRLISAITVALTVAAIPAHAEDKHAKMVSRNDSCKTVQSDATQAEMLRTLISIHNELVNMHALMLEERTARQLMLEERAAQPEPQNMPH